MLPAFALPRSLAVVAAIVVAGSASSGCITANPAVHPMGRPSPLRVVTEPEVVKKENARPHEEAGFSVAGDVGRDDKLPRTFLLLQGKQPIDEQDFYEVAGDTAAMAQVKDYRDRQALLQYLGWVLQVPAAMGCLVTAGSCAWSALVLFIFPPFVVVGGAVFAIAAVMTTVWELLAVSVGSVSRANMLRRNHILPLARAQEAARTYNAEHGFVDEQPPGVVSRGGPASEAPLSIVEVDDDTGCVDVDALRRDIEALGASADAASKVRVRLRVTPAAAKARKIHLALLSGSSTTPSLERELEITEAECRDVPRMVSGSCGTKRRRARKRTDGAQR